MSTISLFRKKKLYKRQGLLPLRCRQQRNGSAAAYIMSLNGVKARIVSQRHFSQISLLLLTFVKKHMLRPQNIALHPSPPQTASDNTNNMSSHTTPVFVSLECAVISVLSAYVFSPWYF
ncbi:hypothetical protein XENTR_v10017038 [Xenopus tropicalis]|nr:hypothetical protein XENTR_v10017038 [Xenopus tropicalis]